MKRAFCSKCHNVMRGRAFRAVKTRVKREWARDHTHLVCVCRACTSAVVQEGYAVEVVPRSLLHERTYLPPRWGESKRRRQVRVVAA